MIKSKYLSSANLDPLKLFNISTDDLTKSKPKKNFLGKISANDTKLFHDPEPNSYI